ncbi:unnamed protein product [Prunus armeniaca]|uniref:peptidylprolyl isomerase n=1 Tax=Prunus armeniaca TaxID=36596 RepID=A0A6J5WUW4_PRUAR|nr:unnamed protein product [Prunus armeniaca]
MFKEGSPFTAGNTEGQGWECPRELMKSKPVRDMLGDGRLIKRRIRDGKGGGMLQNEEKTIFFDTRVDNHGQPLEFCLEKALWLICIMELKLVVNLVPEGFEMCVRLMVPEEIALVTCPPDYAYDSSLVQVCHWFFPHIIRPANVPEGAHVQWEIELLGFEMPKDWTGLNFQTIMEEAEKIRNTKLIASKFCLCVYVHNFVVCSYVPSFSSGTKFGLYYYTAFKEETGLFKERKFELAKAKYDKEFVTSECGCMLPEDGRVQKSLETCNKVLEANPGHVKALYRRGMAYMTVGDFEEAKSDFNTVIQLKPDATAALLKVKQKEQEVEKKVRKQFKGLFDKKPGEIAEAGTEDVDETAGEIHKNDDKEDSDGDHSDESHETADDAPRTSWLSRLWPRRLLAALGRPGCTIL